LGKIEKKNMRKNEAKIVKNWQKFVKMRAFLAKIDKKLTVFIF